MKQLGRCQLVGNQLAWVDRFHCGVWGFTRNCNDSSHDSNDFKFDVQSLGVFAQLHYKHRLGSPCASPKKMI